MERPQKVAYLGPLGTYSHQVAFERFGDSVAYASCPTIQLAFDTLGTDATIAVIPYENSIYGSVIETLNLLRSYRFGKDAYIREIITLPVSHCLVVRRGGVHLGDIETVYSHEQALGQCQGFLDRRLPNAVRKSTTSTAAAAQLVASSTSEKTSAAICSSICVQLFDGLQILQEGIQDREDNFTRFFVISASTSPDWMQYAVNACPLKLKATSFAFLRIRPRNQDMNFILQALALPASKIDRRPRLPPCQPFEDDYFVEVTAFLDSEGIEREVEDALARMHELKVELTLLGLGGC